uniref:Uncharacterized protein n=1 Tax=Strigops habroptila TaxID=2489341 RepID=A0A672V7G7_STRHB
THAHQGSPGGRRPGTGDGRCLHGRVRAGGVGACAGHDRGRVLRGAAWGWRGAVGRDGECGERRWPPFPSDSLCLLGGGERGRRQLPRQCPRHCWGGGGLSCAPRCNEPHGRGPGK